MLGKALAVEGVKGVGSRAMFDWILRAMVAMEIRPVIDRTFSFDEYGMRTGIWKPMSTMEKSSFP